MERENMKRTANPDKLFGILSGMESVDAEALRDRIYDTVGRRLRRKRVFRVLSRCAAVLIPALLAGGIFFYYKVSPAGNGAGQIVRYSEDVKLVLPDGSEIVLGESSPGGLLAENAGFDVVMMDNEVAYRGKDSDVPVTGDIFSTLNVPKGKIYGMRLADGTHVWLNSASKLRFPSVFAEDARRVTLEGEAYFEVAHDAEKPFIVETAGQEVTVLGTVFDVSAYPGDAEYTGLISGKVALKSRAGGSGVILRPGQQARLVSGEAGFSVQESDMSEFVSWRTGVFVFDGKTLGEVMQKLARWYDMEFTFADEGAKQMVVRGNMPIQADISQIFSLFESSGNIVFSVKNNNVTVKLKR